MSLCVTPIKVVSASSSTTTDAGKIRLEGGYRLPVSTTDSGKIRLGGGYRLPVQSA